MSNISETHSRIFVKDQLNATHNSGCFLPTGSYGNPHLSRKIHQAIKGPMAKNITIPGHVTHN